MLHFSQIENMNRGKNPKSSELFRFIKWKQQLYSRRRTSPVYYYENNFWSLTVQRLCYSRAKSVFYFYSPVSQIIHLPQGALTVNGKWSTLIQLFSALLVLKAFTLFLIYPLTHTQSHRRSYTDGGAARQLACPIGDNLTSSVLPKDSSTYDRKSWSSNHRPRLLVDEDFNFSSTAILDLPHTVHSWLLQKTFWHIDISN